MNIIFVRHGKPIIDLEALKAQKMSANDFGNWVVEYEYSSLDTSLTPPENLVDLVGRSTVSVSSDIRRATESVEQLGLADINIVDSVFRESTIPRFHWKWPKLTFFTWAIIFRLAWLLGWSKNGESIRDARRRARAGSQTLIELALKHRRVIHVGHGIMNRLLITELKKRGWVLEKRSDERYWSHSIVVKKNQ